MATYFHGGPEIQAASDNNLQTLYLMNPNYNNSNNNMLLLNHNHHQFMGIPLASPHYSLWGPTLDPSPTGSGRAHQGLSLSLSPQQQNNNSVSVMTVVGGCSSVSNGVQGGMLGSKYLRAAQELLDEEVKVGGYERKGETGGKDEDGGGDKKNVEKVVGKEGVAGEGSQLSTAQRLELQMKKTKLLNMLDEVEQRYKQYHRQMQEAVSNFEQTAGIGSAKPYTSLALHTISRQFRCLKDAILSEVKAASNSLGQVEEANGGSKLDGGGVGPRLRLVDHHLRQQRALQQLGMPHHNAWRPQRGLPERAVSLLRAWLFEHFLHPYPKDSDKHMLAKQTGLTRSQVSNWFINARVRLWKPMVEEMYLEEMKSQDQNTVNSDNTTNLNANTNNNSSSSGDHDQNNNEQQDVGNNVGGLFHVDNNNTDVASLMGRSPKKQRSMQSSPSSILSMDMEMKAIDSVIISNHHHHHQEGRGATGFNPYMVNDVASQLITANQYNGNNGVSLTLGLQNHQGFLPKPNHGVQFGRRLDVRGEDQDEFCGIVMEMGQPFHPNNSNGYDHIEIQNRKGFAVHQLLHKFVA